MQVRRAVPGKRPEATTSIDPELLLRLSRSIEAQLGLQFPRNRWNDLDRRFRHASRELGFPDPGDCIHGLLSGPLSREQLGILAGHLTIGETYFFREPKVFKLLEKEVIPEWIGTRGKDSRSLRIWVAGCSSGEEAYSVAILLHRQIPSWNEWDIRISATDINPLALRRAEQGVYTRWSFRGTPGWVLDRYFFKEDGERYRVIPAVREKVAFSFSNLAEDGFPGPPSDAHSLDLIFCRNVLMYFSPKGARKILQGFHHRLMEGGCLALGAVEAPLASCCAFHPVNGSGAPFFRKQKGTPPAPSAGPAAAAGQPPALSTVPSNRPALRRPSTGAGLTKKSNLRAPTSVSSTAAAIREKGGQRGSGSAVRDGREAGLYQEAVDLLRKGGNSAAAEKLLLVLGGREGRAESDSFPQGEACALLARILADLGRLGEALFWSGKAVAAGRLDPSRRYLRAVILQELGRPAEAAAVLKQALYLDPQFALAHYTLGKLLLSGGRREEAVRCFQNALEVLSLKPPEEELPESGGLTAGGLAEAIGSIIGEEVRL